MPHFGLKAEKIMKVYSSSDFIRLASVVWFTFPINKWKQISSKIKLLHFRWWRFTGSCSLSAHLSNTFQSEAYKHYNHCSTAEIKVNWWLIQTGRETHIWTSRALLPPLLAPHNNSAIKIIEKHLGFGDCTPDSITLCSKPLECTPEITDVANRMTSSANSTDVSRCFQSRSTELGSCKNIFILSS